MNDRMESFSYLDPELAEGRSSAVADGRGGGAAVVVVIVVLLIDVGRKTFSEICR